MALIKLAPNQDFNSNCLKKSCSKKKMFSNNHCIPSKKVVIIMCFYVLVPFKKESFN